MQYKSITYSSTNPYGQGQEETLSLTVDLEETDTIEEVTAQVKNYVLSELNSLETYSNLTKEIQSKSLELSNLNELIDKANERINQMKSLLVTIDGK